MSHAATWRGLVFWARTTIPQKTVQQTHKMTPTELDSYGEVEFAKLERVYGQTLDDKLRAAGKMFEALEVKTPGLKNLLKSKGIGDSAVVVAQIIAQSERYWARRR